MNEHSTPGDRVYQHLVDVLDDPAFPDVDLALRGGRHIGPEDLDEHALVERSADLLADFYQRYGCRLACTSESVYHLVNDQGRLPRRTLSAGEMLVGQTLALLYLSPEVMAEAGEIPEQRLLEVLEELITPVERLVGLLVQGRKAGKNTEVDSKKARQAVATAVHRLSRLGFVDRVGDNLLPRKAILRFTDPVRHQDDPHAGLAQLVGAGGVVLITNGPDSSAEDDDQPETDEEADEDSDEEADEDEDDDV